MKNPDKLFYYHVAIKDSAGKRITTWKGWAQSSEDAEERALNNYEQAHPDAKVSCVAEGHE